MILADIENKLYDLYEPEVIETDNYTLTIMRSRGRTMYDYQPKGYWTNTVRGRIEIEGFTRRSGNKDIVKVDLSNSAGGADDSWTPESFVNMSEAMKDAYSRITNRDEELKLMRDIVRLEFLKRDIEETVRKQHVKNLEATHAYLSDKELRKVIKEATHYGSRAELVWEEITYNGRIEKRTATITGRGVYLNINNGKPDTQRSVLNRLTGRAISIKIVSDN